MTNILQMQEILKSVPDQRLMQEMQQPTGRAPQYLVMTEIQRRKKVRDEYQGQVQDQQTTVAEDMVIGRAPQQPPIAPAGMPPQMSQGMPPQMQPPMPAAQPPMNMEGGGALYRQAGSQASQYFGAVDLNRLVSLVEAEAGNQDDAGKRAVAAVILNRTLSDQFPDTIEAVAEQRTPGGSYQFSPLINTRGDVDQLPAGSAGTRAAVLDLLADFDNKNPVGDALYFQNPEISGMIFPALRGNYDDGKRNNEPFPDGVTKIGDHVFSDRYGNEETASLEPVAFRVEDNALTDIDKKRLGTEEAMKITGAGEEVIMAESEPPPVPPSAFRGGIAGIPEKIAQRTGGFRGPTFAETLQQVSPDARLNVAGYDAAALAGSGLPIGEVPPPAPRPDVVKRMGDIAAATNAAQMAEDPLVAFGGLGATGRQATPFVPAPNVVKRLQDIAAATNAAQSVSPDVYLPVEGYDPAAQAEPGFLETARNKIAGLTAEANRAIGDLDLTGKGSNFATTTMADRGKAGTEAFMRNLAAFKDRFLTGSQQASQERLKQIREQAKTGVEDMDITAGSVLTPPPVPFMDPKEFATYAAAASPATPPRATESIEVPPAAAAPPAAIQDANFTRTPVGMFDDLESDAYSDLSAGEVVVGQPVVASPPVSEAGTPTVAPTGGLTDLIAQLQAGRDDAKAIGILTAGLGIMQQASQPGATLLSSIPGAAAGVKQYSADRANLAKQQLALATLANQQRATDIAAERAAKPGDYERFERDTLADLRKSPDKSKYFYPNGDLKPNVRADIRARWNKLTNPYAAQKSLMSGFTDWVSSNAGIKARTSDKYKALKTEAERKAYLAQQYAEDYKRITGALGTNTGTRTNPLSAYETK